MLWKILSAGVFVLALLLVRTGSSQQLMDRVFQFPTDVLGATSQGQSEAFTNLMLTLVAIILVFAFYVHRYGRWRVGQKTPRGFPLHPPRAFTTSVQYTSWATLYGLVMVTALLIIVYLPEFSSNVLTLFGLFLPANFGLDRLSAEASNLAVGGRNHVYFVGAGLTILMLFAGTPAEGVLRAFFHRRAMIPREAETLFSQLKHDFHRKPIHDADTVAEFLEHSRHDPEMPVYHVFEMQLDVQAALENRLELLPRTEFMLWRLTQRGFTAAIDRKLDRHAPEIASLVEEVVRLRGVARGVNRQLVQVLDGYRAVAAAAVAEDGSGIAADAFADDMARFREIAAMPPDAERIEQIPVSRLDNMASELQSAISRLGDKLGQANAAFAAQEADDDQRPGGDTAAAQAERLRRQLDALIAGFTPLCDFGLETIDEALSEKQPLLRDVCDRTLAFAICAALSASTRPDTQFFRDLGLDPQIQFVRFHPGRAAIMVTGTLLAFLALVVMLGMGADLQPDFFVIDKWLILGGWFIVGSILYGCYHGSAVASLRTEHSRRRGQGEFRLLDCLSAFAVIWSALVIGVFIIAVVYRDATLFAASVPFALVAAVWGVVTAAASMRTLLDVEATRPARDVPLSLIGVTLMLGLIWAWVELGNGDSPLDLAAFEWKIILGLALVLTLILNVTVWWSVRSDEDVRALARPATP